MIRKYLPVTLGLSLFLWCSAEPARADLINSVLLDNKPLLFRATVDDTLLSPVAIVIGGADPDGFAGNWSVEVVQQTIDGMGENDDIAIRGFHNIPPHPGLGEAPVNLGPVLFLFNVVPGGPAIGPIADSAPHGRSHADSYEIIYGPVMAGVSQLLIEARHPIPQPSGFLLLAFGLAGLAVFPRKRPFKRR
jgi:hypothetical protein